MLPHCVFILTRCSGAFLPSLSYIPPIIQALVSFPSITPTQSGLIGAQLPIWSNASKHCLLKMISTQLPNISF